MNQNAYQARRDEFRKKIAPALAILPASAVSLRSGDSDYRYRPSSDLLYLTGFPEPEAVCLLTADSFVLFVRPRNPEREQWDGPRAGVDGARSIYGANEAYSIAELAQRLPELLRGYAELYYRLGDNESLDRTIVQALRTVRAEERKGVVAPWRISDPSVVLAEMRLQKNAAELGHLRHAAQITAQAHAKALAATRPGRFEYEVEAELLSSFRRHNADAGYQPIVAAGKNATILHYRDNQARLREGELLLIDSGAEIDWYTADVTRTFPVGLRFSPEQRAIYELVLEAQQTAIDMTSPGATLDKMHEKVVHIIARGLIEIGLLLGSVHEAIEKTTYKRFFMHRTSHWLGMDVHDVGSYFVRGQPRALAPNMVLTVEPGIYVPDAEDVDARWRGIGVRIEDDVLVTSTGCEVLTASIPKTVAALEAAKAEALTGC